MKVKLLVPICCPDGSFDIGDEPDLSDAIAEGLKSGGYAESLKVKKPVEIKKTTQEK